MLTFLYDVVLVTHMIFTLEAFKHIIIGNNILYNGTIQNPSSHVTGGSLIMWI